jgi:hypothetical protein
MEVPLFYLQLSEQSRSVVLMNSQYPSLHLTITWMNRSGELDIHMTREMQQGPKLYSSIAKLKEADVERFIKWSEQTLEPQLISSIRAFFDKEKPIRPGWLRRRGYLILWIPEEEHKNLMMDNFVKRRRRRCFRLYSNAFSNLNVEEKFLEHLYDPSILHIIGRDNEGGWIQALPLIGRRKNRRKNFFLKFIKTNGDRGGWFAIDSLVPGFEKIFEPIHQTVVRAMPGILNRVFDELRLHELKIERDKFTSTFSS